MFIVSVAVVLLISGWYYKNNESLPKTNPASKIEQVYSRADELANKMLQAINIDAWNDINYIQWTFRGKRHFVWDKHSHLVQVSWKQYMVLINPNTSKGIAYDDGELLKGKDADKLVEKAIDAFNNDSFWLNAPAKVFDQGTERSIVEHDGKDALMVKYISGGSTPGDSYLWILDENGLPLAWKMWVSIIPIGGMKLTWEEWKDFDGAMLSQFHDGDVFDVRISNIKTGSKLTDLGIEEDLFEDLI